jgi:type I restriction enzyme S subunit
MVNSQFSLKLPLSILQAESQELTATVSLREVFDAGVRLEASVFNIEAHNAISALRQSRQQLIPLYGKGGLCLEAHNAGSIVPFMLN